MSHPNNDALLDKAREYHENGSEKLKSMIDRCIKINDLDGLQWVLAHATLEDTKSLPQEAYEALKAGYCDTCASYYFTKTHNCPMGRDNEYGVLNKDYDTYRDSIDDEED